METLTGWVDPSNFSTAKAIWPSADMTLYETMKYAGKIPVLYMHRMYEWQSVPWSEALMDAAQELRTFFDILFSLLNIYCSFMFSIIRIVLKICLGVEPYVTPVVQAVTKEWTALALWHQFVLLFTVGGILGGYKLARSRTFQGVCQDAVSNSAKHYNTITEQAMSHLVILQKMSYKSGVLASALALYAVLRLTFSSSVVAVLIHWSCVTALFTTTWKCVSRYNMTEWSERPRSDQDRMNRVQLSMKIFNLLETWVILAMFDLAFNAMIRLISTFIFWNSFEFSKRAIYSVVRLHSPVEIFLKQKEMELAAQSALQGSFPIADFFSLGPWRIFPYQIIHFVEELFGAVHDLFVIMLLMAHYAEVELFNTRLRKVIVSAFDKGLNTILGIDVKVLGDDSIDSPRKVPITDKYQKWKSLIASPEGSDLALEPKAGMDLPPWINQLKDLWSTVFTYIMPEQYRQMCINIWSVSRSWILYAPHVSLLIFPSLLIRLAHPLATVIVPCFKALQALNRWDIRTTEFWLTQIFACQMAELVFQFMITMRPDCWFQTRIRLLLSGVFAVVLRDPAAHMNQAIAGTALAIEGLSRSLSVTPRHHSRGQSRGSFTQRALKALSGAPQTQSKSTLPAQSSSSLSKSASGIDSNREETSSSAPISEPVRKVAARAPAASPTAAPAERGREQDRAARDRRVEVGGGQPVDDVLGGHIRTQSAPLSRVVTRPGLGQPGSAVRMGQSFRRVRR